MENVEIHASSDLVVKETPSSNKAEILQDITETVEIKEDTSSTSIAEVYPTYEDATAIEDSEKVQCLLEDVIYLITTDHGGQTEFLDLMSRFLMGPSLNLIFSRLTDPLDTVYKIYTTNEEGVSTNKENSIVTLEEVICQTLASIACMEATSEENKSAVQSSHLNHNSDNCCSSKAMFVGTFKDKVSERQYVQRDKLLRKKIEQTEFYRKGIIEYANEDYITLPVDNRSGTKEEINTTKTKFENCIKKHFGKVHIPCTWLIFNIVLRSKNTHTIAMDECKVIAGKLGIGDTDLHKVLWFLHYRVGSLLYYPKVKGFENIIICDIRVSNNCQGHRNGCSRAPIAAPIF